CTAGTRRLQRPPRPRSSSRARRAPVTPAECFRRLASPAGAGTISPPRVVQPPPRSRMRRRAPAVTAATALLCTALLAAPRPHPPAAPADERDRLTVGLQPDGRIVVPTNQILRPAGRQVTFPGR